MPDILDLPIAQSRLVPPRLQRDWIPRQRLVRALGQADHVPVTLIVAPPGSGKSGLLAQWILTRRESVAWLALDERDNSLGALSTMLAQAINAVEPDTIAAPLRYLELAVTPPDPLVVATHFLNDLADFSTDLFLVLDDAHLLTDPGAVALVQALALSQLPGLRLIIAARNEPPWPLAPLRGSGRLLELRAPDLRLTADEVAEYARQVWGEPVSPEIADTLWTHTAGWLAGVRFLCAGSHRLREIDAPADPVDPARSSEAMGWLLNEALGAYPDSTRALLLRLAIPERINRALVEALTGDLCSLQQARDTYDTLLEDGLFLSSAEPGWSRVPGHVRHLLVNRLVEREGHAAVRRLHGIARDWLMAQGLYDEAIAQARAMGDPMAVAAVISAAIEPTLAAEEWRKLEDWLAELPAAVITGNPELLIGSAWVVRQREELAQARELIHNATRLIEANARLTAPQRAAIAARVDVIEGGIAYMRGDAAQALSLVTDAIPRVPPENAYTLSQAHFVAALSDCLIDPAGAVDRIAAKLADTSALPRRAHLQLWAALGIVTYQQGDMRRTTKIAAQMRDLGSVQGSAWTSSWGDALAALATYERGELAAAVTHATALLERTRGMHRIAVRECLYILALTYEARAQWDDADTTLNRLEEFILAENTPRNLVDVDALRARFALRRGEAELARAWLAQATVPDTAHPSHSMGDARIAHLAVAVSLGFELEQMRERIERILADGAMFDTLVRRVELMLLLAIALHRLGHGDRARSVLGEAMALGHPTGLTRVFLDLGSALLPVLDDAIAHGIAPAGEAKRLRGLAAMEETAARAVLQHRETMDATRNASNQPLTDREQEVLQLVTEQLSNKEIGAKLGISPLTVKRHTINIYAKIGVTSRRQAIERFTRPGAPLASPFPVSVSAP